MRCEFASVGLTNKSKPSARRFEQNQETARPPMSKNSTLPLMNAAIKSLFAAAWIDPYLVEDAIT
jgi:hypothetical protein